MENIFGTTTNGYVYFIAQPFSFGRVMLTYKAIKGYHLFKVIIVNTLGDRNTYYFNDDGINALVEAMNAGNYEYIDGWWVHQPKT